MTVSHERVITLCKPDLKTNYAVSILHRSQINWDKVIDAEFRCEFTSELTDVLKDFEDFSYEELFIHMKLVAKGAVNEDIKDLE